MEQTFLALTRNEIDLEWLQSALSSSGQVLNAGSDSLDELLALVDVTGANLLFVGLDRDNLVAQTALIEGALEAKPMLAVVALGDGLDNQLVLSAMRAGARDFVAYGSRASEVAGLVRRLTRRLPNVAPSRQLGQLTVLFGVQADADGAFLATHLALGIQRNGQRTLLLDLSLPRGDGLSLLGLENRFGFGDAMRNLRRLDSTMIDSAFGFEPGGLRVLAHGTSDELLERCSAAELYLLLGVLRQHYQHVVVNLTGQGDSEAARTFINNADHLLCYTDQSVPNCRRNLELLNRWRESSVKLDFTRLLVDRYLKQVAPESTSLGKTYEMPVAAVLPFSPEARLNARNQGRTLFDLAPRDPLAQALTRLADELSNGKASKASLGLFKRLLGNHA